MSDIPISEIDNSTLGIEPGRSQLDLGEPFSFNDASIILRAGGVDFAVHKSILSSVSPIFKDMFTLSRDDTSQEGIPIVELEESSQVIYDLLSFLYMHINDPALDDIPSLLNVMRAAQKYELTKVVLKLIDHLEKQASKDPLLVFVLACQWGFPDVARTAALHTLKLNFSTLLVSEEVTRLPTKTYQKLLVYHSKCGQVASQAIQDNIGHYPTQFRGCADDQKEWWTAYQSRLKEECRMHPLEVDYTNTEMLQHQCRSNLRCRQHNSPALIHSIMERGKKVQKAVEVGIHKVQIEFDVTDFFA
ncbi:hypothetical protein QCA50_004163 [Cerrena zonata]|uniref:BTB domain-containing protein n=1 Tax=Cerrena zonata TaxID=2478898 RepID=A0AAW0GG43_9APHY